MFIRAPLDIVQYSVKPILVVWPQKYARHHNSPGRRNICLGTNIWFATVIFTCTLCKQIHKIFTHEMKCLHSPSPACQCVLSAQPNHVIKFESTQHARRRLNERNRTSSFFISHSHNHPPPPRNRKCATVTILHTICYTNKGSTTTPVSTSVGGGAAKGVLI